MLAHYLDKLNGSDRPEIGTLYYLVSTPPGLPPIKSQIISVRRTDAYFIEYAYIDSNGLPRTEVLPDDAVIEPMLKPSDIVVGMLLEVIEDITALARYVTRYDHMSNGVIPKGTILKVEHVKTEIGVKILHEGLILSNPSGMHDCFWLSFDMLQLEGEY